MNIVTDTRRPDGVPPGGHAGQAHDQQVIDALHFQPRADGLLTWFRGYWRGFGFIGLVARPWEEPHGVPPGDRAGPEHH